jgi:hypothetical protein
MKPRYRTAIQCRNRKKRYQAEIYLAALQNRNLLPQYKTEINCRDTKPQDKAEFYRRNTIPKSTKPKYKKKQYKAGI